MNKFRIYVGSTAADAARPSAVKAEQWSTFGDFFHLPVNTVTAIVRIVPIKMNRNEYEDNVNLLIVGAQLKGNIVNSAELGEPVTGQICQC